LPISSKFKQDTLFPFSLTLLCRQPLLFVRGKIMDIQMTIKTSGKFTEHGGIMGRIMTFIAIRNQAMPIMAVSTGNLAMQAGSIAPFCKNTVMTGAAGLIRRSRIIILNQ